MRLASTPCALSLVLLAAACATPVGDERSASSTDPITVVGWEKIGTLYAPDAVSTARDADGRVEAFWESGGTVYHSVQASPGGSMLPVQSLDGQALKGVTAATNADGRLEIFAIGGDGHVYHRWQTSPNGAWGSWDTIGGSAIKQIDVARNADGRLEVIALGSDGVLYDAWQVVANGSFGAWAYVGGSSLHQFAVANDADGRLDVLAVGGDANVYRIAQVAPNGGWGSWSFVGGSNFDRVRLGANLDGRLEVIALNKYGGVSHAWQNTPNGGYSGFVGYSGQFGGTASAKDIAVSRDAAGRLAVFAAYDDGHVREMPQAQVNGGWQSTWNDLTGAKWDHLAAARNADGRMEVFAAANYGQWHTWQTTPNGPFTMITLVPSVSFSNWSPPSGGWTRTALSWDYGFTAVNDCKPTGHVTISEGGATLLDADLPMPKGTVTVTPPDAGTVEVQAWASCIGVPNSTVTSTKEMSIAAALGVGTTSHTCPSGETYAQHTFCVYAPEQTDPPQCYLQMTRASWGCTYEEAQTDAHAAATNWDIKDGACPSNCE